MFVTRALAAAEEAGLDAERVFPPFDSSTFASQLLWLAITFAIFYLLMARAVIPRIAGILETRRDRISRDFDEARRLKDEAETARAAWEEELAAARGRAHAIGQEARDKAKAEAQEKRAEVEARLNGRLAEAEERIAEIRAKAMGEVGAVATATAMTIVEELAGERVDEAEIAAAIAAG